MLQIICGHGGGDSGAVGNGYQEQELVRKLADRIKYYGGANVVIGDTTKNWYVESHLWKTIPKDNLVLELHLDSFSNTSAKGGHVIILSNIGDADEYDTQLAKFISTMFPGRSAPIVERSDLANPKRAYKNNLNYRLLECCFISNSNDVKKFNNELDVLAKGILECFNINHQKEEQSESLYCVQVGAYSVKENAEKMAKKLEGDGYNTYITIK